MGKKSIMRMLLTLSISQICYMFIVVMMFGLGVFFLGETEIIISPNAISQNVERKLLITHLKKWTYLHILNMLNFQIVVII